MMRHTPELDVRRSQYFLRALTAVSFVIFSPSFFADVQAAPDDKPVSEAEASDDASSAPEKPRAENEPDEELIKSLDDEAREFLDQALERLQRAFDGMQQARHRIAQEDTSAETQKTQEKVVDELEDLLALVRKQQARNRNRSQQNQSTDNNRDQRQSERQKLPSGPNDPQNSGSPKNPGKNPGTPDGGRKDGKSPDSQERSDAARVPTAEQARRRQAIKDVWGHLPPHIREAMLNSVSEKYLPRYEDLVKKYYEDLAEKNRKQNGK